MAQGPGHADRKLIRRFYATVDVAERPSGHVLMLDGRLAKTPARNDLALATEPAARALADEWARQGETLDLTAMPITRLVNAAIDGVANAAESVREDIVRFASSDLLCYRAEAPRALVEAQARAWDPVLDWVERTFGACFHVAEGLMPVAQPEAALGRIGQAVEAVQGPVRLACLHTLTTLSGSALLALAVSHGWIRVEAAWAAAHVDEDFQIAAWGADEEAAQRRALRWREMEAAARLLELLA